MKLFSRGKQKSGKPIGKNVSTKAGTKPNSKPGAKPAAKASSKPTTKSTSKPATKVSSGSAPKKPTPKVAPATKQPTSKPTATTASNKPKSTPTSKPAVKATTKAVPKPAQKSITTPANKPVSKTPPRASAPSSAKPQTKSVSKPTQATNQWRNEPGVSDPLRVGRGIRTRDDCFVGQDEKQIHSEINSSELYRRVNVLDIDADENMAVVKTHTARSTKYSPIPNDTQKRTYQKEILTQSGSNAKPEPIHLKKGQFELAPRKEDVTIKQAEQMLSDTKNSSKKNRKRIEYFKK